MHNLLFINCLFHRWGLYRLNVQRRRGKINLRNSVAVLGQQREQAVRARQMGGADADDRVAGVECPLLPWQPGDVAVVDADPLE